jgi:hypothetical protein
MDRRHFFLQHVLPAFGLIAIAGLLRYWVSPLVSDLPGDYANEGHYAAESRFRNSPTGEWEHITLIARRVDQTIARSGGIAMVQGDLHWYAESGAVIFENAGLYGVDRRTRANVRGYGDVDRTGQFLFPLHVQPTTYAYWDPNFIGPRVATFDHADMVDGLPVYVFRFTATALDETAGYSYLPDVPERYRAHTDGQGTLWIEPISGIVVDYEEQGVSYFVDRVTGKRVADLYEWSDHFTPETRAAQVRLATQARLRLLALEDWLPAGLVLVALAWLVIGIVKRNGVLR